MVSHELYHAVSGIHVVELYFCVRNSRNVSNKSFVQEMILVKGCFGDSPASALVSEAGPEAEFLVAINELLDEFSRAKVFIKSYV